eukprot:TRINITY_DN9495_c0_g1_i2.p1 TRINITY_DN9495_c0_g1~~TRINITY_DN9495_c0_g1_i2.p1  ORF type:complete len:367 (+),score=67.84 TRINITY_DN9495_c0_g1_i2:59-1159(+)
MTRDRSASHTSTSSRYSADRRTFSPGFELTNASRFCSVFLAIGGIVMIVIGATLGLSADETDRNNNVLLYNQNVVEWNTIYREEFSSLATTFFSLDGFESRTLLPSSTQPDPTDQNNDDLIAYTPLKYTSPANEALDLTESYLDEQELIFNFTTNGVYSTANLSSVPLFYSETIPTGSWKDCFYSHGGTIVDGSKCVVYYYLESSCIKVQKSIEDVNVWILDDSYGDYGCTPDSLGAWKPNTYRVLRAKTAQGWVPDFQDVDLSPTTIMVRSSHDPYIVMNYLTDGSLDFGPTKSQQIQGGLALIIVGCMLVIPPFMVVYIEWKQSRNERRPSSVRFDSVLTHSARSSFSASQISDVDDNEYSYRD